jgi:hypothetical protein
MREKQLFSLAKADGEIHCGDHVINHISHSLPTSAIGLQVDVIYRGKTVFSVGKPQRPLAALHRSRVGRSVSIEGITSNCCEQLRRQACLSLLT